MFRIQFFLLSVFAFILSGCIGISSVTKNTGNLVISPTNVVINPADGNHSGQIILYNNGIESLSNIVITPNSPLTIQNNTCSVSLGKNQSCSFNISTTNGLSQSGTTKVLINYFDGDSQELSNIYVTYLIANPLPALTLNTYFDFTNTPLNQGPEYIPVLVTNTGNTILYNLTFNSVNLQNSAIQYGGIDSTCNTNSGNTLNPESSCILMINYQPSTVESNNLYLYPSGNYFDRYGNSLSYTSSLSIPYSSLNINYSYITGSYGAIQSSSNGSTWSVQTKIPFTNSSTITNTLTNNRNTYVSANNDGTMYQSTDGLFWNSITSPGNTSIIDLLYIGNTYYLAGGVSNRNISASTNLTTWNTVTTTSTTINNLNYLNRLFIATLSTNATVSSQGSIWIPQFINGNRQYNISMYDGTYYYLLGNSGYVAYSLTGTSNWTVVGRVSGSPNIIGSAYGNNAYIAIGSGGNGTIYRSTNPISGSWTLQSTLNQTINAIAFANNLFVIVGNNGTLLTSINGVSWNSINLGISNNLVNIYYDGSQFWVTGTNIILTSTDGVNWYIPAVKQMSINGSNYVAVSQNGEIAYSTNLTTWAIESTPTANSLNSAYCSSVNYCIAVGNNGTLLVSQSGGGANANWLLGSSSTTQNLNSSVCGISLCIAVGNNGTVVSSANLSNWTNSTPTTANLNAITFINGLYIAVGDNGTILTAIDNGSGRLTWQTSNSGTNYNLNAVKCTNYGCVAVGNNGTTLASSNGYLWNSQNSPTINNLLSVAYINGTYIATGSNNTILTSNNGVNWNNANSAFGAYSGISLNSVVSY